MKSIKTKSYNKLRDFNKQSYNDSLDERLNGLNDRPRRMTQKMINVNASQIVRNTTDLKQAKVLVKNQSFKKISKNSRAKTENNLRVRQSLRKGVHESLYQKLR